MYCSAVPVGARWQIPLKTKCGFPALTPYIVARTPPPPPPPASSKPSTSEVLLESPLVRAPRGTCSPVWGAPFFTMGVVRGVWAEDGGGFFPEAFFSGSKIKQGGGEKEKPSEFTLVKKW